MVRRVKRTVCATILWLVLGGCDPPPTPEAIDATVSHEAIDATPLRQADSAAPLELYPDAYMKWGTYDGFYLYGDWIVVTGDGRIGSWGHVVGHIPDEFPPQRELTVATARTDDLFARWLAADIEGLPHAGKPDNWPVRVQVRLCADCETTTLDYYESTQVKPELVPLWAWFDDNIDPEWHAPRDY